jgi:hypothetical protein
MLLLRVSFKVKLSVRKYHFLKKYRKDQYGARILISVIQLVGSSCNVSYAKISLSIVTEHVGSNCSIYFAKVFFTLHCNRVRRLKL